MSRAFSICLSTFWTGPTAKQLRQHPPEVRELAFYLFTNETAQQEWFGLYRFDLAQAAQLTGRKAATLEKTLAVLDGIEYARYDPDTEYVWVREMAFIQSGAILTNGLKAADFKCRQARRWYNRVPRNPFLGEWFDRYVDDFHLLKDPDPCTRREWAPRGGPRAVVVPPEEQTRAEPELFDLEQPKTAIVPAKARLTREQMFDAIVARYPKADDLRVARKEWLALKPNEALFDEIMRALDWQIRQVDWIKEGGQYVPGLSKYLKNHRWTDKPRRVPHMSQQTAQTISSLDEFVRGAPKE